MSRNEVRNAAIIALKHYGFGPHLIARVLVLELGVVSGVLFRAGLTRTTKSVEKRKRGRPAGGAIDEATRSAAVEYAWKHTQSAAAAEFGISRSTIAKWQAAA